MKQTAPPGRVVGMHWSVLDVEITDTTLNAILDPSQDGYHDTHPGTSEPAPMRGTGQRRYCHHDGPSLKLGPERRSRSGQRSWISRPRTFRPSSMSR